MIREYAALGLFVALAALGAAGMDQAPPKNERMASLTVRSSAFEPGQPIPRKYTREGEDIAPPLEWSGVPQQAQELALIVDDPDAPRAEPWVHWVVYKIPADRRSIPEGSDDAFVEGTNDFGESGYGGPMPPPGHGIHHYRFKLYALDVPLTVQPGWQKSRLLDAMKGHVISQGELVGTYERK
jgi:Raf kinase inhibitor-like YbhB/YbcL family protein